jgi:hypothetical protein
MTDSSVCISARLDHVMYIYIVLYIYINDVYTICACTHMYIRRYWTIFALKYFILHDVTQLRNASSYVFALHQ